MKFMIKSFDFNINLFEINLTTYLDCIIEQCKGILPYIELAKKIKKEKVSIIVEQSELFD